MAHSIPSHQLFKRLKQQQNIIIIDGRHHDYSEELAFPVEVLHKGEITIERLKDKEAEYIYIGEDQKTSIEEAERIEQEYDLDLLYVKGGMQDWGRYVESIQVGELSDGGEVYQFIRPSTGQLSYMIISEAEALLLNPGLWIQPYIDFVEDKAFTFKHIVDSCIHRSHISSGPQLAEEVEESYWLPEIEDDISYSYTAITHDQKPAVGNTNIPVEVIFTTEGLTFEVDQHYTFTSNNEADLYKGKGMVLTEWMKSYSQFNEQGFVSPYERKINDKESTRTQKIEAINKGERSFTNEEAYHLEYGNVFNSN